MRLVKATLITTEVEPEWPLTADDVPLGKAYVIDLDNVEPMTMMNTESWKHKDLDCVWVVEPQPGGWMPLMAFKVEES